MGRSYYKVRRQRGLCGTCGQRPATEGLTTCAECREHQKQATRDSPVRARRIASGVCAHCGSRPPLAGKLQCAVCSGYEKKRAKQRYANCQQTGMCAACLKAPATVGVLCLSCGEKRDIRSVRWHQTHPEQSAETKMQWRHNISRAEHQCMRDEQQNCCKLCRRGFDLTVKGRPHTDHSHVCLNHAGDGGCPDCIRGLLCPWCNQTAVPFFERYPERQTDHERWYMADRPILRYRAETYA